MRSAEGHYQNFLNSNNFRLYTTLKTFLAITTAYPILYRENLYTIGPKVKDEKNA